MKFETLSLDFSKNRITEKTLDHLIGLAEESKLTDAIEKYFGGDIINVTENRAVLHTALRNTDDVEVFDRILLADRLAAVLANKLNIIIIVY